MTTRPIFDRSRSAGRTPDKRRFPRPLAPLVLVLLVCAALALPTLAQPPWGGAPAQDPGGSPGGFAPEADRLHDRPHGFVLPRVARVLDLSETQVEQARGLLNELAASSRPLREEGRALRTELHDLLDGAEPDPATVGSLVIRGHALREAGRLLREAFEADFTALLTPEQLERWELLKDLRMLHRGPHRGGRR